MENKLYAAHTIENTINLLKKYSNSINEKSDMKKVKNRILNDFKTIELMTKEILKIVNNFYVVTSYEKINSLREYTLNNANRIRYAENDDVILGILHRMFDDYKDLNWEFNINDTKDIISDLIAGNKTLHTNLTVSDSNKIIDNININREFNIFSPIALDGNALFKLSNSSNGKAITYGLERKDNYHANAKQIVNRMIKGRLQGSTISNNVFDMMQVTAPVSWKLELGATGSPIEKLEKSTFRNIIRFLRQDGIFIYTMPITRLTRDIALMFSKALKDVNIIKKEQDDFYVHIIGKKDIQSEPREDVFRIIMDAEVYKRNDFAQRYDLPSGGIKQPEFFRGSVLDEDELAKLVENSGLISSFWKSQEVEEKDDSSRPLLPFNMGQIGLVLTSGCLDGMVEEFPGQYHAIKGMVTKIKNTEDNREGQNETSVEIVSNKVQINLLTPDGEFIELA